jgi:hypothetical protein
MKKGELRGKKQLSTSILVENWKIWRKISSKRKKATTKQQRQLNKQQN